MVTSSNVDRGAGGPSRRPTPRRRKSHDQNHGRPRENAAAAFWTRFFWSFEEKDPIYLAWRADGRVQLLANSSGPLPLAAFEMTPEAQGGDPVASEKGEPTLRCTV